LQPEAQSLALIVTVDGPFAMSFVMIVPKFPLVSSVRGGSAARRRIGPPGGRREEGEFDADNAEVAE
jgi:hypothetical protein